MDTMPFIYPGKVHSKLPVSRFKPIAESLDFILQKKRRAFRRKGRNAYRVVTKFGTQYAMAHSTDYDAITNREWNYIVSDLPDLVPQHLEVGSKERNQWSVPSSLRLMSEMYRLE